MTEKKNSKTNALLIVVIVLLVAIIIGGVAVFMKLNDKPEEPAPTEAVKKIGTEAGIVTNEEDAANVEVGEPITFTTLYERDIYIKNGKEATCYIGNSDSNYYEDMYIQIYIDDPNNPDGLGEELYVSQIIPRGSHIESFTANKELEPGDYQGTLIHSSVDKDGNLAGDTPVVVEIHVE